MRIHLYLQASGPSNKENPSTWNAVLTYGEHHKSLFGSEAGASANRMELRACIEGVAAVKKPCEIEVHAQSAYLEKNVNGRHVDTWVTNGWKTKAGAKVANQDLWQELITTAKQKHCKLFFVKDAE